LDCLPRVQFERYWCGLLGLSETLLGEESSPSEAEGGARFIRNHSSTGNHYEAEFGGSSYGFSRNRQALAAS
jgi:hypothetical protein